MAVLEERGYIEPLREYIAQDRPFLGICIGMQTLFEASEETPGVKGVGVIPGTVTRFDVPDLSVPHIGWNEIRNCKPSGVWEYYKGSRYYFVHSFCVLPSEENKEWQLSITDYGTEFVSAVQKAPDSRAIFVFPVPFSQPTLLGGQCRSDSVPS